MAKIPEIWLPHTQKWCFSFPITQQFFFILGENIVQTHVCISKEGGLRALRPP